MGELEPVPPTVLYFLFFWGGGGGALEKHGAIVKDEADCKMEMKRLK